MARTMMKRDAKGRFVGKTKRRTSARKMSTRARRNPSARSNPPRSNPPRSNPPRSNPPRRRSTSTRTTEVVRYRYRYRKNPHTAMAVAADVLGGAAGGGFCHGVDRLSQRFNPAWAPVGSRRRAGLVGLAGVLAGAIAGRFTRDGTTARDVSRAFTAGASGWAVCKAFSCEGGNPPPGVQLPQQQQQAPAFPAPAPAPTGRLYNSQGRPVGLLTDAAGQPVGRLYNAAGHPVRTPAYLQDW